MSLKVGIQMYSVKNAMKENPLEAIANAAEIGYKYLEFANHNATVDFGCGFPVPTEKIAEKLRECNAYSVGAHIMPLKMDNIEMVIDFHSQIGTQYLITPVALFSDMDRLKELCVTLNKVGERCLKSGMRHAYHNHIQEFQKIDGEYIMDLLMRYTDPELVELELDTYWVLRSGLDPVETIKRYGHRVTLLHQKDIKNQLRAPVNFYETLPRDKPISRDEFLECMASEGVVEVGTGGMDIQGCIDAVNAIGVAKYIILEQDYTALPEFESITTSVNAFKRFSGISWD